MNLFKQYRQSFVIYLTSRQSHAGSITILCKSFYVFLLIKMLYLWPVIAQINDQSKFGVTPSYLNTFLVTGIIFLLAGLILQINYIIGACIFLFSFAFSRVLYPVTNGSDLVLNLYLFLAIFLSIKPTIKNSEFQTFQGIIQNFTFLFCKIQLALIYLLSGSDKLMSVAWRSGDAIFSILNLNYYLNPIITMSISETACFLIAWVVILFEISFAFLIWIKKIRPVLITLGVLFHLAIAVLLSLPDFGIVMILLYSLFIQYPKKIFGKSRPAVAYDN